jgi:3-hydroxyacyl-[acyl-carrier-protein] dehydratase
LTDESPAIEIRLRDFAEDAPPMPPPLILDPALIDLNHIVADIDAIRDMNPQRFEMEAISAIVLIDTENKIIAGYRDVTETDFWVRGHMPGFPLMPGVLLCEAAAQLCSYFVTKEKLFDSAYVGLGGLDEIRFRGMVRPGDRLLMVCRMIREKRIMAQCYAQGFVGAKMVFDGKVQGFPLRQTSSTEIG